MQFSFLFSIFARRNDTKLNDMRKILLLAAVALMAVVSVQAQRRSCLHSSSVTRASEEEALPLIMDFDPQKTYRQPVVLVSFNDRDFSMDNMPKGCRKTHFLLRITQKGVHLEKII